MGYGDLGQGFRFSALGLGFGSLNRDPAGMQGLRDSGLRCGEECNPEPSTLNGESTGEARTLSTIPLAWGTQVMLDLRN